MAVRGVSHKILRRAARSSIGVSPELADQATAYLELLARWNRRINLTALPLDPPTEEAIDRLILEPFAAARHIKRGDLALLDVGSGGGSPAIPLKLAVPRLHVVMVEIKVRKSAFLREAVRHLGLDSVDVETARVEELLARPALNEGFDLLSLRAVRVDGKLLSSIEGLLRPGGRLLWFGAPVRILASAPPLTKTESVPLLRAAGSHLGILTKDKGPPGTI